MSSHPLPSPLPPQNPFDSQWLGDNANVSSIAKKFECWKEELKCDCDKEFLLNGIEHGFRLSDQGSEFQAAETSNHFSAYQHKDLVEKELKKQL